MPKRKPDQVIRHEIVFGRSERDLIEGALMAYQFNRVATPTVALLSDVSAMALILGPIAGYLGFTYVLPPTLETGAELVQDFQTQYSAFKETPEYLQNQLVGAPLGPGGAGLVGLLRQLIE
mgnify:FL=1